MIKKIILYSLVGVLVLSSYFVYNIQNAPEAEGHVDEVKNFVETVKNSKKHSTTKTENQLIQELDFNSDGLVNDKDIAYMEMYLNLPPQAEDVPQPNNPPAIEDIPSVVPPDVATPAPAPAPTDGPADATPTPPPMDPGEQPSWIKYNVGRVIQEDSSIFEDGKLYGEYIYYKYDSIFNTLAFDYKSFVDEDLQYLITEDREALYTLNIWGDAIDELHIYAKEENHWKEVLTIDMAELLYLNGNNFEQVIPIKKYGEKQYTIYVIEKGALYLFDNDSKNGLSKPLSTKEIQTIIDEQSMLSYASTPIFLLENDINLVRFLINGREVVIRLPEEETVSNIKQITALQDKLVFSFDSGAHYITKTINIRSGIYLLTEKEELVSLRGWEISHLEASTDVKDRIVINLYDNTRYYYDIT